MCVCPELGAKVKVFEREFWGRGNLAEMALGTQTLPPSPLTSPSETAIEHLLEPRICAAAEFAGPITAQVLQGSTPGLTLHGITQCSLSSGLRVACSPSLSL